MLLYAIILECLPDSVIKVCKVIQEATITVFVPKLPLVTIACSTLDIREFKHDVYGRRQTAKVTSDFPFFSRNH